MNVVAKYIKDPFGNIVGIKKGTGSDIVFIPIDQENSDYIEIMKLVEEGKLVIEPAE